MDTLLTEIIGSWELRRRFRLAEAGTQLRRYFSMLSDSYRGFTRIIADQEREENLPLINTDDTDQNF
jgi:hypothetical protein